MFVRLSRKFDSLKEHVRRRDKKMRPKNYVESATQTDTDIDNVASDTTVDPPAPPKKVHDTTWMMNNVNEEQIVASIAIEDIQQSPNEVTSKGGYELLCSYSWKQTDSPTIYVPGTPATFTFRDPKEKDIFLEADTGVHWIDQHAERVPKHQFEPIFQALAVQQPEARFDDVDIVVNRSSLQQLLKWVGRKSSQAFHLDLDIVGSTLFIGRKVKKPKVASTANSFGRNFEDFFTTEDAQLEDSEGHHRVLEYDFGGLTMVIRVEEDAFLPNTEYAYGTPVALHPSYVLDDSHVSSIAHTSPQSTTVIAKGTLIPQSSMIELKSNVKIMPKEQMWLGRTQRCALGRLEDPDAKKDEATKDEMAEEEIVEDEITSDEGIENNVSKRRVKRLDVKTMDQKSMGDWETKNQEGLRKLVWLLQRLQEVVMEKTDGSAVMVSLGKGEPLQIYGVKDKVGALPQEIIDMFWN